MRIWGRAPLSRLTERERDFFVHFLHGYSLKEIAARMAISASAASHLKSRLMEKLSISTDIRLVLFGLRHGLLDEHGMPTRVDGTLMPLTDDELAS